MRRPPRFPLFPNRALFRSPVGVSPLNVALPLGSVVAVLLLAVAPAGFGVAVTTTPPWLTGLPFASWSWTTGCCTNGAPLCAVLDGGLVITSRVAAPGVAVGLEGTGRRVRPEAVAVSVL